MSVELSHRLAWVRTYLPGDLTWMERRALWLACERAGDFSDLSEPHQQLVLRAEAAREHALAERRSSVAS